MITIAANAQDIPDGGFCVYVFRHGEKAIYVGQTIQIGQRICDHTRGGRSNSFLTEHLRSYANEMEIDLYDGADVIRHFGFERYCTIASEQSAGKFSPEQMMQLEGIEHRHDFENHLIKTLKPTCNRKA